MRTLRTVCVITLFGIVGFAAARPSWAGVTGPCKLATKGDSPVAKACVQGGAKEAKKAMDRMVKQANQGGGNKIECSTCHDGTDDARFDLLKKDGREQFTKLIATLKATK